MLSFPLQEFDAYYLFAEMSHFTHNIIPGSERSNVLASLDCQIPSLDRSFWCVRCFAVY